jgi:hypothetical protein
MASEQIQCPIDQKHFVVRITLMPLDAGAAASDTVPEKFRCCAYQYACPHCGPFVVSHFDDQWLRTPPDQMGEAEKPLCDKLYGSRHKIQALLKEQESQMLPKLWLQLRRGPYSPVQLSERVAAIHIDELLERWPKSVGDTLDRILQNLGRRTRSIGAVCHLGERSHFGGEWLTILFAEFDQDANYYLEALQARGWIRDSPDKKGVVVTPAGWARIDEIKRGRPSPLNPAFVAMWFGDDKSSESQSFMRELYENHMQSAINSAGYRCERVDLVPHNEFIMDKALGMIRVAPFVVADFTGNRGGVYFEAGFARGLRIPVIHTCRRSHFAKAHFDIQQINTIVWDAPTDLAEPLYHRIVGTPELGPGPYQTTSTREK